jgi:pyruvate/2-oxoglutarate dehydrogenase complex dihydrolipoamide dehydrogenase (E3) component
MVMDYDLIVVGGTPEAIIAAEFALQLGARVALVIPDCYQDHKHLEIIYHQAWNYNDYALVEKLTLRSIGVEILSSFKKQNFYKLASLGVDIIQGKIEFYNFPKLSLVVNQPKLRLSSIKKYSSSSYLLATSSERKIPHILGLEKVDFLIPENIYNQENLIKLPPNITVINDSIEGIIIAQQLNKLGKRITLITPKNQILIAEDKDASFFIQASLEAAGITILTKTNITQIRVIEGEKWIQAGNKALQTDAIIVATDDKQPNISGLNLQSLGVKFNNTSLSVNSKLQTTNPQIYACGDLIGGYNLINIAQYEAKIAVKNALFFPYFNINYNCLPYIIFTEPNLARVGLTEKQAQRIYGNEIEVINNNFEELSLTKLDYNNMGFSKIILSKQGEILGCHLVGENVGELIGIIALAIQNKINFTKLEKLVNPYGTSSEIITFLARQFNYDRLRKNTLLKNLLETFFIWKR